MKRTKWFERKFPAIEDNGIFPSVVERLAGAPARVEEAARSIKPALLGRQPGGRWSVKQHIGHLSDLEPLWSGRVDDFIARLPELRPADLLNRKTEEADHNGTELEELLKRFREHRQHFVKLLRGLSDEQLEISSMHPRLKTPMRPIDLAYFVAEHDDHHLADIYESTQN